MILHAFYGLLLIVRSPRGICLNERHYSLCLEKEYVLNRKLFFIDKINYLLKSHIRFIRACL